MKENAEGNAEGNAERDFSAGRLCAKIEFVRELKKENQGR